MYYRILYTSILSGFYIIITKLFPSLREED